MHPFISIARQELVGRERATIELKNRQARKYDIRKEGIRDLAQFYKLEEIYDYILYLNGESSIPTQSSIVLL